MVMFQPHETTAWFDERMLEVGMTQSELSRTSGISKNNISRYRMQKQKPGREHLETLAASLNVEPLELMVGLGIIDSSISTKLRASKLKF